MGRPREFDAERALERAMLLFWRQGYEGTSITDLTSALGVSSPSLYAAFGSKEELFLKAFDRYEAYAGVYREEALNAPNAREYARALLHGAAELHGNKKNPPGCLGVQGALACGPNSDAIRKELIHRRKMGEAIVRDRLKRAKAEGDLPDSADPADLARYLSIMIYGITVQAAGGATKEELLRVADVALLNWPEAPRKKTRKKA